MAAAPPPPLNTVRQAITLCGVDDANLHNGLTQAQRIAADVFQDDFRTCVDKTIEELDADFKSCSDMTQVQGQIRLNPGNKNRIRALMQWARDEFRLGRNPANLPFPVADTQTLLRRYKTHQKFTRDSKTLADAAKPEDFTNDTKWEDWVQTFMNYLRLIPGRDGAPLKYVCRLNEDADPTPHQDFLDDCVAMAPLASEAFAIDAATVHTLITSFIAGNDAAEAKTQALVDQNNGRADFTTLREHYEGVGALAHDAIKAETTIRNIFCNGERKPHMWWDKFEKELTQAFVTCDRHEGREVCSDEAKLRKLLEKVNADILANTKAALNAEMIKTPRTLTCAQALAAFRNEVNRRFPPSIGNNQRTRRNINQAGRNNGGRGRSGRNNGKRKGGKRKSRPDAYHITLTDGAEFECHPSCRIPSNIFNKMKPEDKDTLKRQRDECKRNKGSNSVTAQLQEIRQTAADHLSSTTASVPTEADATSKTQISQVTNASAGSAMMGGRNEQANFRGGAKR